MTYSLYRHTHSSVATQRKMFGGPGNFATPFVSTTMQSFSTTFVTKDMITSMLLVPTTVRI